MGTVALFNSQENNKIHSLYPRKNYNVTESLFIKICREVLFYAGYSKAIPFLGEQG